MSSSRFQGIPQLPWARVLSTVERPTAPMFYEPLIYALGKLSSFQPYKGVPLEIVRDEILRLVGVDPEKAPWSLKDTSTKERGVYRIIYSAWYFQTRRFRPDEALCAKPMQVELNAIRGSLFKLLGMTSHDVDNLGCRNNTEARKIAQAKKQRAVGLLAGRKLAQFMRLKMRQRELDAEWRGQWALTDLGVKCARQLQENSFLREGTRVKLSVRSS